MKRLEEAEIEVELELRRVLACRLRQGYEDRVAVVGVGYAAGSLKELDEVAEQRRIAQVNLQGRMLS